MFQSAASFGERKPAILLQEACTVPAKAQSTLSRSFFDAVGRALKCHKLGTLLVTSGLITASELAEALKIQKETGEQLGKILVQQGIVPAVQLYRKLAEQWCLRASVASVALVMMAPGAVHAEETRIAPQFQMAAAAVNPAPYRPSALKAHAGYPGLFGSQEVRSDDISAFKKWTAVIGRFEEQMKTQSATPRILMWKSALRELQGKSPEEQIEGVNAYINAVRYKEDMENYGKSDYWATPAEFFSKGGDCEDFAIAKYASLRALGFSSDSLRIAIVQDTIKNIAHALLIVYTDAGAFVLDNQNKHVENAGNIVRYQPIFSINSTSWWLHRKAVS
jgi:predicted transglutaminase-like cysteine proteinase